MSNFEEKFNNWRERMNQKSEKEKHNYALSVAFFIAAIATFFVVSNWYFVISGNSINTSIFTEIERVYSEQKQNISEGLKSLDQQKNEILDVVNKSQEVLSATSSEPL